MSVENEITNIFSRNLRGCAGLAQIEFEKLCEIRLRAGKPVLLKIGTKPYFLAENGVTTDIGQALFVQANDLAEIMEYATNYSIYAYEEEMANGFLTIKGGHRIGICGRAVMENGNIKNLRNISSLNIRVAHEKTGCAEKILPCLFDADRNISHTLIYAPPGKGKTTVLRDLIRLVSDVALKNVSVIDERFEIAAEYLGTIPMNLGIRSDVLSGCPKSQGMELALRAMAPQVLAVDELGGTDFSAVEKMACCGVSVLATIHAKEWEDLKTHLKNAVFKRFVGLEEQSGYHFAKVFDDEKKLLWEGIL